MHQAAKSCPLSPGDFPPQSACWHTAPLPTADFLHEEAEKEVEVPLSQFHGFFFLTLSLQICSFSPSSANKRVFTPLTAGSVCRLPFAIGC
jgi:hypothetical protein